MTDERRQLLEGLPAPDPDQDLELTGIFRSFCDAIRALLDDNSILRAEIDRLRAAIRQHRDQADDDRCWLDDRELYAALGGEQPSLALPPECEFLESCRRYWRRRRDPSAPPSPGGMTIAELEADNARLRAEVAALEARVARHEIRARAWEYDAQVED